MESFPIFMRLRGRDILVVGGGDMAQAKRRLLEAAGARVTVAAALLPASLAGFALVFGASGNDACDRAVSVAARAAGMPVNVVDRPDLSDFIMPAVVDRGDVVIGISTNGGSPILAQRVRGWIEDSLPVRLERLAAFARRFRSAVQGRVPETAPRRRFWERFFDGEGAALVLAGREQQAARIMIRDINSAAANQPMQGAVDEFTLISRDPSDLTLRMLAALRSADVIAYEAALPAGVLDYARRDARRCVLDNQSVDFTAERDRGQRIVILRAPEDTNKIAREAGRR